MTKGVASSLIVVVLMVGVAAAFGTMALADEGEGFGAVFTAIPIGWAALGAAMAWKRPDLSLSWIYLLAPALAGVGLFFGAAAISTGTSAGWLALAGDIPLTIGALSIGFFGVILFPTGSVPGPRWRAFPWAAAWAIGASVAIGTFVVEIGTFGAAKIPNPLPWAGALGETTLGVVQNGAGILTVALVILGAASLPLRYRRATPYERRQIMLVTLVVALALGALFVAVLAEPAGLRTASLVSATVAAVLVCVGGPVAILVAVVKRDLFGIDRFVSRTVTYAVVTSLAAALFAVVALAPTAALDLGDAPPALVAVGTLVAAGVFNPLRRRIQAIVDRRFNRARYDAQLIADGFAMRLQNPRELDVVTADLAGTVRSTMHPERIGLWVRA